MFISIVLQFFLCVFVIFWDTYSFSFLSLSHFVALNLNYSLYTAVFFFYFIPFTCSRSIINSLYSFESNSCQIVKLNNKLRFTILLPISSEPAFFFSLMHCNIVEHKGRQAIQMKESTFEGESGCCNMFCQSVCVSKAP